MSTNEATQLMTLAIGRLLRLASRPEQPGDVQTYHACRAAILDAADVLGITPTPTTLGSLRPGWNFGGAVVD